MEEALSCFGPITAGFGGLWHCCKHPILHQNCSKAGEPPAPWFIAVLERAAVTGGMRKWRRKHLQRNRGDTREETLLGTQLELHYWKEVLHARGATSDGLQMMQSGQRHRQGEWIIHTNGEAARTSRKKTMLTDRTLPRAKKDCRRKSAMWDESKGGWDLEGEELKLSTRRKDISLLMFSGFFSQYMNQ